MTLAVQAGLRLSELIGLDCADVQFGTGAHVRCMGKGRKQRCVPLTASTVAVVRVWLQGRGNLRDQPLFPTRAGRRLSDDAVERRIATHTALAAERCPSLGAKKLTPHVLRHTSAMTLLHAGVDVGVIALWLSHADIRSTQVYLHADLAIKERASPAPRRPRRTLAAIGRPITYWPSWKHCNYADGDGHPTGTKPTSPGRHVGIIARSGFIQ
jgi:site-specific recombinase XerC